MSAENGSALPVQDPAKVAEAPIESKGKGKAAATEEDPVDQNMDDDDDSSDDEVSCAPMRQSQTRFRPSDYTNTISPGRR
jgi:hypothetical protein